ncbi:MAG: DUF6265 family protein [Burkholderiales bacterium]
MKHIIAAGMFSLATSGAFAQPVTVQRLAWLQGCWAIDAPERTVEEQWMAPRAGSLLGMSRTVRGGKLTAYESVILRERGDRFEYEVSPSGQASTAFSSKEIGDAHIVFENLQHDFPQRVGYARRGAALDAWIEGPMKGQTKRIEYAYQRVPCGGTD